MILNLKQRILETHQILNIDPNLLQISIHLFPILTNSLEQRLNFPKQTRIRSHIDITLYSRIQNDQIRAQNVHPFPLEFYARFARMLEIDVTLLGVELFGEEFHETEKTRHVILLGIKVVFEIGYVDQSQGVGV